MNGNSKDDEIKILRGWKRLSGGCDEISKRVNEVYAKTEEICETVKETAESFDIIFEIIGFKDELNFCNFINNQSKTVT